MKIFIIIFGSLAGLIVAFTILLFIRSHFLEYQHLSKAEEKVAPVIARVKAGQAADGEIEQLAADLEYRNTLYSQLKAAKLEKIFPEKYLNQIAFAESDLAFWLSHPNELQRVPEKMEFVERVARHTPQGETVYFLVFRFAVDPPHWAAEDGWMVGVTGPYLDDQELKAMTVGTWSELEGFSPESVKKLAEKSFQIYLDSLGSQEEALNIKTAPKQGLT